MFFHAGWGVAMDPLLKRLLVVLFMILTSRILSTEGSLTTCELRVCVLPPSNRQEYYVLLHAVSSRGRGEIYVAVIGMICAPMPVLEIVRGGREEHCVRHSHFNLEVQKSSILRVLILNICPYLALKTIPTVYLTCVTVCLPNA